MLLSALSQVDAGVLTALAALCLSGLCSLASLIAHLARARSRS